MASQLTSVDSPGVNPSEEFPAYQQRTSLNDDDSCSVESGFSVTESGSGRNEESQPVLSCKLQNTREIVRVERKVLDTSSLGEGAMSESRNSLCLQSSPENSHDNVTICNERKKTDASVESENMSTNGIESLPMDALHSIASLLTPHEWCNTFGLLNKSVHGKANEIIRRVYLHSFRCATEVVSAWKLNEWEDSRELAALYISNGVPIYPRCLGHSYRTIRWKMAVQAEQVRALESEHTSSTSTPTESQPSQDNSATDSFFRSARNDRLGGEDDRPESTTTYAKKKSLFFLTPTERATLARHYSGSPRARLVPQPSTTTPHTNHATEDKSTARRPLRRIKKPIQIHQHLLDQHYLCAHAVNDSQGRMLTPPISLSADFFHPSPFSSGKKKIRGNEGLRESEEDPEVSNTLSIVDDIWNPPRSGTAADGDVSSRLPSSTETAQNGNAFLSELELPVLDCVDLQVYSSTTMLSSSEGPGSSEISDIKLHMGSRFATYHRRLEKFLGKGDIPGFEECLLDFWDEFFPHTAGIHYHDLETAIPRVAFMHKFLTRPCPKAVGVVQCEIERIKIPSRGKGVNVTGRLFPSYEYRLFIRNRPLEITEQSESMSTTNQSDEFIRRDTVLMVAKNRGRKHTESSGVSPQAAATKKGSNNFYLYMPQQMDADAHFNTVNENFEEPAKLVPNGASHSPILHSDESSSILLGRLQSNFIGTEFQIFTPRLAKLPRRKREPKLHQGFGSDDDLDYDSGTMSSDNASYRRSRFSRFRRSGTPNPAHSDKSTGSNESSAVGVASDHRSPLKRAVSSPDISHHASGGGGGRHVRTNRRAIANDTQQLDKASSGWVEEEDGAITYTANLLGSRPRIMDVCVPKVAAQAGACSEWKRYLANCDDSDSTSMINCFRQLQQHRDAQDLNAVNPDNENEDAESEQGADDVDFGLMALQNRPPWWNVELGSFVLNFGGRVSVASIKNFQLCERTDQDQILLQFGRINGRHSFTMDFQHPLTAVQAFSIAISSLQSKISFG